MHGQVFFLNEFMVEKDVVLIKRLYIVAAPQFGREIEVEQSAGAFHAYRSVRDTAGLRYGLDRLPVSGRGEEEEYVVKSYFARNGLNKFGYIAVKTYIDVLILE